MSLSLYFSSLLAITLIAVLLWTLHKKLCKARILRLYNTAIRPEWIALLQHNVPLYSRLPDALRAALHGHINCFLDDKIIVGRNGLKITEQIRLTIAGNACLLVLKRSAPIFTGFKTVLVYPETYVAPQTVYNGTVVVRSNSTRAGESWHRGPVVLAWSDVLHGSSNEYDGHNVVLHEFAHKLDEENHLMNGLPVLREAEHYDEWNKVLNQEYDEFMARVAQHKNAVIDAYGATSPVEFFAVITESFFEKPAQMQDKLPELYTQLAQYFDIDPAMWRKGDKVSSPVSTR